LPKDGSGILNLIERSFAQTNLPRFEGFNPALAKEDRSRIQICLDRRSDYRLQGGRLAEHFEVVDMAALQTHLRS
jgi:hypothetical protein